MKPRLFVGAALLAIAALAFGSDGIAFAKDYPSAVKQAKASKKVIMIDFYTDWCGWCKKLDSDTYSNAEVAKLSEQFVSVKLNAEKEGADQAKKYAVRGFPTILFVNAAGQVQGKLVGYLAPKDFIPAVQKILEVVAKTPALEQAVAKNPKDGKALAELAELRAVKGDLKAAEETAAQAKKAGFKGDELAKAMIAVANLHSEDGAVFKALNALFQASETATSPKLKSNALGKMLDIFQELKAMGDANTPRFAKMIIDLKDADPADVEKAKKAIEPPKPVQESVPATPTLPQ